MNTSILNWRGQLLSLVAGAAIPLSLAPFNYWPIAVISLAIFAHSLIGSSGHQALKNSFLFGLGYYGSGASWVFVSIYSFGSTPLALALLMTALFVIFLALLFSLPWYFSHSLNRRQANHWTMPLNFAVLWVLNEWLRSWVLTGFPWLYIGYGHLDTPLAGWAPVTGIFGLGLILAFSAAWLARLIKLKTEKQTLTTHLLAGLLVVALWSGGDVLRNKAWTQVNGEAITVGMVQPNIPQNLKWADHFREPTLDRLRSLSENLWVNYWVIWPEAAVPILYHEAGPFLLEMDARAQQEGSALITGILYDDHQQKKYFNSILGLGKAMGLYHKQRLVPFGEYVPLERWLRGLIAFFDLPTSVIHKGPGRQQGLLAGDYKIAPSICYEIVYPGLVSIGASQSDVLLTISNDAWFGHSIGPLQHMEMAQMRALETGRYLIRSTNNGLSGIVDTKGKLIEKSEQFKMQTLSGQVIPMTGLTPFLKWGSAPVIAFSFFIFGLNFWRNKKSRN